MASTSLQTTADVTASICRNTPQAMGKMTESAPAGWNLAGIAGEDTFERLLYNRSSAVVVAQFRRESPGGVPIASLYARRRHSAHYAALFERADNLSYEDPVSASLAPVLMANVIAWDEDGGGHWHGVARVDLERWWPLAMLRPGDLPVAPPYTAAEVTHLHCSRPDGVCLVCTIALSRPATEYDQAFAATGDRFVTIDDHWLCELNLELRTYEKLTALVTPFF